MVKAIKREREGTGQRLHGSLKQKDNGKWWARITICGKHFSKTYRSRVKAEEWLVTTRKRPQVQAEFSRLNARRRHGSLLQKDNGKWLARVRVGGGKRIKKTHDTKEAAESWIAGQVAASGKAVKLPTTNDDLKRWVETTKAKKQRRDIGYLRALKRGSWRAKVLVEGTLFQKTLKSKEEAEEWVATMRFGPLKPKRGVGCGALTQLENGTWKAGVRVDGKRIQKNHKTKEAAEAWIASQLPKNPPPKKIGFVRQQKSGKWYARVGVDSKKYSKTLHTREEAEAWIHATRARSENVEASSR
jgi:hypothetical protein